MQQKKAIFCFQDWLCIQIEQINETRRRRGRHCGRLKHMEVRGIDGQESRRSNKKYLTGFGN